LHGKESVQVFWCFSYIVSVMMLEIQLSRGKRWHAINCFNHAIFFVPVINAVGHVLFFISINWGDRWLFVCSYWWNCWPSLL